MKFILQNDNQVRYFNVRNGGRETILAEIDTYTDIHHITLTNPTFEETKEDILRFINTSANSYHLLNNN